MFFVKQYYDNPTVIKVPRKIIGEYEMEKVFEGKILLDPGLGFLLTSVRYEG